MNLPLWQRFLLATGVTLVLLAALVIYVNGHNTNSNPSLNETAELRANREAEILVAQDQAPRSLRLAAGLRPGAALERAVHARIASQIAAGAIDGPIERSRCQASGSRAGGRRAFRCVVVAGNVSFPFLGVVDTTTRRVTYCKRDPPPTPSDNVPVSSRCRL